MIPRVINAQPIGEDMWMVVFLDEEAELNPMRLVPANNQPKTCPGGIWCEEFGCELGNNKFTNAEPVLLVEEGKEVPEDFSWDDVLGIDESVADIFEAALNEDE